MLGSKSVYLFTKRKQTAVCMSVFIFVCLFANLSLFFCLSVYVFVYLSCIGLYVCQCLCLSVFSSIRISDFRFEINYFAFQGMFILILILVTKMIKMFKTFVPKSLSNNLKKSPAGILSYMDKAFQVKS